jgi:hypothetical protein
MLPGDGMRYLTYRATCAALNGLVDDPSVTTVAWELQSHPIERPNSK